MRCVKELIEQHGALPNLPAVEGSTRNTAGVIPPLVVAAARGMALVVRYLLTCEGSGEWMHEAGTSRFRLFTNSAKSIRGTYTPLQFARTMRTAELEQGAKEEDLKSLNICIKLLERNQKVK